MMIDAIVFLVYSTGFFAFVGIRTYEFYSSYHS